MTHTDSLAVIPDDELFATVQRLTARSNVALADLMAHLGEVERRGIHRSRACASLPALVEPIGPAPSGAATHVAFVESLAGPVRELSPGKRPEDWMKANDDDASCRDDPGVESADLTEHQC